MTASEPSFTLTLDEDREQRLLVRREGELYATTCLCGYFSREGRPTKIGGYTSRCRLCNDRIFVRTSRELAVLYGIGNELTELPLDQRAAFVSAIYRAGSSTLARLRWEELQLAGKTKIVADTMLCCPGCGEDDLQIRRDKYGRIGAWSACGWRTFTASRSAEILHVGVAAMLSAKEIDWMRAYRRGETVWNAWTRRPAELLNSTHLPNSSEQDSNTTIAIRESHV